MTSLKSFFLFWYTKGEKKQKEDSVPFGENPIDCERKKSRRQQNSLPLNIGNNLEYVVIAVNQIFNSFHTRVWLQHDYITPQDLY
jgi:hypothetical protein